MHKEGTITQLGRTSEKAGFVIGGGTVAAVLFLGNFMPIGVAVNALAGSFALVLGGKLAQERRVII